MDAIIIRIIDLPYGVKGMTAKDENDDYNIYINARYSPDIQAIAYRHEIDHILKGHFYDDRSVREKEEEIEGQNRPFKRR